MIKIAVPNKGALSEESIRLIADAGYKCRRAQSELVLLDTTNNIEFYFLRPRDIAIYVGNGQLDMGITGRDLALDSMAKIEEIMDLNFGHSRFFYAAPCNSGATLSTLAGKRIATSYPTIVEQDLKRRNQSAVIIKLDGAVEISIKLGVADIIADVVQSGRTLTEAGLATFGDPILSSEAILIGHSTKAITKTESSLFIKRLKGIIVAREFVMIEYDIPKSSLDKACITTPGIESPTISPLSDESWVAIKSMIKKKDANTIMDSLADIGAKGIFVTDIRTCRI